MGHERKNKYCLKLGDNYFINYKMSVLLDEVNDILENEYRGLVVLSRNIIYNIINRPQKVNKAIHKNIKAIYGDNNLEEKELKEKLDLL